MKINLKALNAWALFSVIGYLFDGQNGLLIGLAIGLGISFIANFLD